MFDIWISSSLFSCDKFSFFVQSATDTIYQAIVAAFISRDPQITAAGHFLSCAILMFLHRKLPILWNVIPKVLISYTELVQPMYPLLAFPEIQCLFNAFWVRWPSRIFFAFVFRFGHYVNSYFHSYLTFCLGPEIKSQESTQNVDPDNLAKKYFQWHIMS